MRHESRATAIRQLHATLLTRRSLTVFLCWSLASSLAVRPGHGGAFADDGRASSDKGDTGRAETDGNSTRRNTLGRQDGRNHEDSREAIIGRPVLPLKDIIGLIDPDLYGTIIAVDLRRYRGNDVYQLKTRDGAGVIRNLWIDARTGRLMNILEF